MLQEGKAETSTRHPSQLGVTKKPQNGVSIKKTSCITAHTKLWFDTQPREWGMDLFQSEYGEFNEKGEVVGRPCAVTIYKKSQSADAPHDSSAETVT